MGMGQGGCYAAHSVQDRGKCKELAQNINSVVAEEPGLK